MKVLHGVFNIGCFWPEEVKAAISGALSMKYMVHPTRHVADRITQYGLQASAWEEALEGRVVEAEFDRNRLHKIVTRRQDPRNPARDLCAVVVIDNRTEATAIVITMWVNHGRDFHRTLKRDKYVSGWR